VTEGENRKSLFIVGKQLRNFGCLLSHWYTFYTTVMMSHVIFYHMYDMPKWGIIVECTFFSMWTCQWGLQLHSLVSFKCNGVAKLSDCYSPTIQHISGHAFKGSKYECPSKQILDVCWTGNNVLNYKNSLCWQVEQNVS